MWKLNFFSGKKTQREDNAVGLNTEVSKDGNGFTVKNIGIIDNVNIQLWT